jgi:hypothetical protein
VCIGFDALYYIHVFLEVKGPCHKHIADNKRKINGQPMVGMFTPQCDDNGNYKHVQCHGSTGYCFCVDHLGKKIPGTEQRGRPDCSSCEFCANFKIRVKTM